MERRTNQPATSAMWALVCNDQILPVGGRHPGGGRSTAMVLVSLSTMPGQGSPALAQSVLDALAGSAIRVVMTTGALPPDTLNPPENAVVFGVVPHQAILPEAALMVTHGGHGSVMGALAHGVPLVCIPGVGADQPIVGERIVAVGAGRLVAPDAVGELGDVVTQVLSNPSYRAAARHMETLIDGIGRSAQRCIRNRVGARPGVDAGISQTAVTDEGFGAPGAALGAR